MKIYQTGIIVTTVTLSACSDVSKFTPTPDMTGKQIFSKACSDCHAPVGGGDHIMEISAEYKDPDKLANKLLAGSMLMPSFPNIQGASAKLLVDYVIENSKTK